MKRRNWLLNAVLGSFIAALSLSPSAFAEEPIRVLFLSKSSGFEHDIIKRGEDGSLSPAERTLVEWGKENNFIVVPTKDAGMISAPVLEQFDVVMFYTTGDLTQRGNDNNPQMTDEGRHELIEWVNNGGGFVGSHTATDTFSNWSPYVEMVGAAFATHGQQQEATLIVKDHPITSHFDETWTLYEEWYYFRNLSNTFTPLMILDSSDMIEDYYKEAGQYPFVWIEEVGEGRVFHSALGHRLDVWEHEDHVEMIVKAIHWAAKRLQD